MRTVFRTRVTVLGMLLAMSVALVGCPGQGDIVIFKDSALEAAVRAELGQPLGFLSGAALRQLTRLDARGRGVRNLSGLEYATELEWLDLDTNRISDVTPLGNLLRLKMLNLDSNEVFDISPLQGLLELRSLSLFNNQVADISALVANAEVPGGWGERPGVQVVLDYNTLSDKALNVDVPRLRTLGVNVVLAQPAGN